MRPPKGFSSLLNGGNLRNATASPRRLTALGNAALARECASGGDCPNFKTILLITKVNLLVLEASKITDVGNSYKG